jgi:hypothetical protein
MSEDDDKNNVYYQSYARIFENAKFFFKEKQDELDQYNFEVRKQFFEGLKKFLPYLDKYCKEELDFVKEFFHIEPNEEMGIGFRSKRYFEYMKPIQTLEQCINKETRLFDMAEILMKERADTERGLNRCEINCVVNDQRKLDEQKVHGCFTECLKDYYKYYRDNLKGIHEAVKFYNERIDKLKLL